MRTGISRIYVSSTAQLSDGIITGPKLAATDIITLTAQLANGIITGPKLAAVDIITLTAQLANGIITGPKLAATDIITLTAQLADGVVNYLKIAPNTVNYGLVDYYLKLGKVRAYRATSNQTFSLGSWTKVQFNAETFDELNGYDPATNYRFTVPANYSGYYLIHAQVRLITNAAEQRAGIAIYKNGALVAQRFIEQSGGVINPTPSIADYIYLTDGNYIEIYVYNNVNSEVIFGSDYSYLNILKVF